MKATCFMQMKEETFPSDSYGMIIKTLFFPYFLLFTNGATIYQGSQLGYFWSPLLLCPHIQSSMSHYFSLGLVMFPRAPSQPSYFMASSYTPLVLTTCWGLPNLHHWALIFPVSVFLLTAWIIHSFLFGVFPTCTSVRGCWILLGEL